jgi:fatty-acyl-CoA synthase
VLNLAAIHEAIAEAVPERECLVFRDRRYRWREITDRTRRLADVLRQHGLGCRRERADLRNWESGQDHVGLYLYNGNEYLEGMLGAYKARAAPFNVNYRYVDEELGYLFDNADAKAVIYHASFAPTLARIRDDLSKVHLWLQVDDGSGAPLMPGALDYEQALAAATPAEPAGLTPDDLYLLYTGGTTGMPKGVLWRQEDILRAAMYPGAVSDLERIVERAKNKTRGHRALPTPPFMHGTSHWAAFTFWHVGGTVVVQSEPRRLDPADIWSTVEREKVEVLNLVGDAFARPLLDELRRGRYEVSSLRRITTGGAILSPSLKRNFVELIPQVEVMDVLGSSESGMQGSQVFSGEGQATTSDFSISPDSVVLRADLSQLAEPGSGEQGWLARRGNVPLGYYGDAEKTARTFPVVDGVRHVMPGDRAALEADGSLRLLGRDSVTINTGGEKVFAEEVEQALKQHPAVYDAVVVGTPHERWGQQVTAIVSLRAGQRPTEGALRSAAGEHIAAYKLPKAFVFVEKVLRSPSGKADYRWAKETAADELG